MDLEIPSRFLLHDAYHLSSQRPRAVYVRGRTVLKRRPPPDDGSPPAQRYVVHARHLTLPAECVPSPLPEWASKVRVDAALYRRLPGIYSHALLRQVWAAVVQNRPALMRRTDETHAEQAGLILLDERTHTVTLRRFEGPGKHTSVEPHCRGRRADGRPSKPFLVIGEFHTHPQIPPADIAPPSMADLYQLALSAGMREHNLSVVIAPEGVYACRIEPRRYEPLMAEIHRFLRENNMTHRRIETTLNACEQPIFSRVNAASTPLLHSLLSLPGAWFRDLMGPVSPDGKHQSRAERIATFVRCCREHLGIHIQFKAMTGAVKQ